jgi:hypothetical protein
VNSRQIFHIPSHDIRSPPTTHRLQFARQKIYGTKYVFFSRSFCPHHVLHLSKTKFIFMAEIDKIMKKVFALLVFFFAASYAKVFLSFFGEIIDRRGEKISVISILFFSLN